jgi:hypothetical protein
VDDQLNAQSQRRLRPGASRFQPTPESIKAMADLTLASRVRAALAAEERRRRGQRLKYELTTGSWF